MAHTNQTTNYHLPQFISTDKPAWLSDINGAFNDIDLEIKNASDAAGTAGGAASAAQADATQALTDAHKARYYQAGETFKFVGSAFGVSNPAGSQITLALVMPREIDPNCSENLTTGTISSAGIRDVNGLTTTGTVSNMYVAQGAVLHLTVAPATNVAGNRPVAVGFTDLTITFTLNTP